MKTIFENVIKRGGYNLPELLNKIDSYHVEGKLTNEERDDLYVQARGSAKVENGANMMAKLAELEERVRKLENSQIESPDDQLESSIVSEYIPGKWYYNGDKISFEGKQYVCANVPEGSVCTWSPAEYPAYWAEI